MRKRRVVILTASVCVLLTLVALPLMVSCAKQIPPRVEQKLVVAWPSDVESLDMHRCTGANQLTMTVMETLTWVTPQGEIAPCLAESWEMSKDATSVILHLREGVKFHDGEVLNAEAVKLNFDRRLDPAAGTWGAHLLRAVAAVSVVDEYTVKIENKYSFAATLYMLAHPSSSIQSPVSLRASWDKAVANPIGTGPFVFKEYLPGDKLTMVANENYWGEKPKLSEVVMRVIPDAASRMAALDTGEVDVALDVPAADIPRLEADPNINIDYCPSKSMTCVGLNNLVEPFTDKRVRQALNYAVNKETIVKYILGGAGHVADSTMSPALQYYTPIMTYEYNIEKAKALLTEAGYPDGFTTTLHYGVGFYNMGDLVCTAVQADLAKVGVKVKLIPVEGAAWYPFILHPPDTAEHKMFLFEYASSCLDAFFATGGIKSSDWPPNGGNASFYRNEKVDELLDRAMQTVDPQVAKSLYTEAITIVMDDAPWLFMYSSNLVTGIRANVKGAVMYPTKVLLLGKAWIE
jgi:ABC-type transport system substrate-binding protein